MRLSLVAGNGPTTWAVRVPWIDRLKVVVVAGVIVVHAATAYPPSPLMARVARGAYAAYLLHPPVLVALSAAARPLPVVPETKFLLVAAAGVPACYAVGYLVSRPPGVRRVV